MNRLRLTGLTAAVAAAFALSACGTATLTANRPVPSWYPGGEEVITPFPGQATPASGSTAAAATATPAPDVGKGQPSGLGTPAATVSATGGLAFDPASSTVKVGAVVQWTNTGSVPHNVTFAGSEAATSPTLNQGDTWQVTFSAPGTYSYHCTFHPGMNGQLTVTG